MLPATWKPRLERHRDEFDKIVGVKKIELPALLASDLIRKLCVAITAADQRAVSLALALLREDPRMPFGGTLKSQIARTFKFAASSWNVYQRDEIIRDRDKLLELDHPPRETAKFERVVRAFERARAEKRS